MHEKQIKRYQIFMRVRNHKLFNTIIILIFILLVYLLVHFTGNFTYVHTMYIPILYASFVYSKKTSFLFGVLAGLLAGPFMIHSQYTSDWLFRMVIFAAVGLFSGIVANELREDSRLFTVNQMTNIPNQNYLRSQGYAPKPDKNYSIYSILINNCSILVDLFGMDFYTQVLVQIYKSLKEDFGDSCLIMQPDLNNFWITDNSQYQNLNIKDIWKTLEKEITIGDVLIYLEYSIGVTYVKGDEVLNFDYYYKADIAARYAHKNAQIHAVFDDSHVYQHQQFALIGEFMSALKEDQLYLDYQPIINLRTKEIDHFEALIRWYHPKQGLIRPDAFIPLIEQTHLIHQLTSWVINEALQQILSFKSQGIPIKVSVNISVKNLQNTRFVENVKKLVQKAGVSPCEIELEIVETEMLANSDRTKNTLKKLHEAGFKMSIDDFGKGYSSISYLKYYHIDKLKIDNTFISRLSVDQTAGKIVKSIIDITHELGLKVVCEGVEDGAAEKLLRLYGADFAQGYHFAHPIEDKKLYSWYVNHIEKSR